MKHFFYMGAVYLAVVATDPSSGTAAENTLAARGEYLVTVMDCGGCHTPRGQNGAPIAEAGLSGGNIGFEIPGLGIFWPSNLTPEATGLEDWSVADIVTALRTGVRPDGRMLAPIMPTVSFSRLTDEDAEAIATYLKSLAPARTTAAAMVGDAADAKLPFYRVTFPPAR